MLKKLIEALRKDSGYDFIANNYTKFTKAELKTALLEAVYIIHNVDSDSHKGENILADFIEEWIC